MKKILLPLLLCCTFHLFGAFSVVPPLSQTFYVSPSGNDNNDGFSPATAWQTLNKLNTTDFAGGGNMILLEGGQTFTGNIEMNAQDWGSPSNPNVLASYGTGKATIHTTNPAKKGIYIWNTAGWEIKDLIIKGTNTPNSEGINFGNWEDNGTKHSRILIENCEIFHFNSGITIGSWSGDGSDSGFENITIRDNVIHDTYDSGINLWGYFLLATNEYSHSNVHIHNNTVYNIAGDPGKTNSHTGSGIVVGQVDGAILEHNLAYNGGWNNSTCGGPVAIWGWDSNDLLIQYNEAHSWQNGRNNGSPNACDGGGFDLDGGVTNSIMQYNYSHDNEGPGYLAGNFSGSRPFSNNTIRYNISENDALSYGASIVLFNAPGDSFDGLDIYNNTVYVGSSNATAFDVIAWGANMVNVNVSNNIFYKTTPGDMLVVPSNNSITFKNNLYYAPSGTYNYRYEGVAYTSLKAFRNGTGQEVLNGNNVGFEGIDPLLSDPGNGGTIGILGQANSLTAYTPQTGAPVINTGLDLQTVFAINPGTIDYTLNSNWVDNYYDIGAVEYNGECLQIDLQLILEGAYDTNLGTMNNALYTLGILPTTQPYSPAPWNYQGTEGTGMTLADFPPNTVDWVLISFRSGIAPSTEVFQTAALLLSDGNLHFPACAPANAIADGSYYLMVEHRNHMGILSPVSVNLMNSAITFDFTKQNSYTVGAAFGQKDLGGVWSLPVGDYDQTDQGSYDINGMDKIIWNVSNGIFGQYKNSDGNLDGDVNGDDRLIFTRNSGLFSSVPK